MRREGNGMSRASVKAKMPIKERGAVRITVAGTRMRTRGHGYGIDCAGMLRAMRATDDVGVLQPVDLERACVGECVRPRQAE